MKKISGIVAIVCLFYVFSASAESGTKAGEDTLKTDPIQDSVKDDNGKASFGRIKITSTQDSINVIVDSVVKGIAPVTIDSLLPGQHTILIRKKGYFIKKLEVAISADSTTELPVTLVRPGGLVIKCDPSPARLYIDEKESGTTPWENFKLKPGDYTIRLEFPYHAAFEKKVTVKEDAFDTVNVVLDFTKAYTDSIAAVKKRADEKKHRVKLFTNVAVFSFFIIFGIVIAGIEISNN